MAGMQPMCPQWRDRELGLCEQPYFGRRHIFRVDRSCMPSGRGLQVLCWQLDSTQCSAAARAAIAFFVVGGLGYSHLVARILFGPMTLVWGDFRWPTELFRVSHVSCHKPASVV